MFSADAARFGNALLEGVAGAEHPHTRVTRRQIVSFREGLYRYAFDIDFLYRIGVLGLERCSQPRHTRTDFRLDIGRCGFLMLQLPGEQLESLRSRSAASVTIDNGIAKKTVEPRHDRFGVWCNIGPSQYPW